MHSTLLEKTRKERFERIVLALLPVFIDTYDLDDALAKTLDFAYEVQEKIEEVNKLYETETTKQQNQKQNEY